MKTRSGKVLDPHMDELSALFGKSMKFTTSGTTSRTNTARTNTARTNTARTKPTEDELFSKMFGNLTIGKSKRHKRRQGKHFTRTKKHKTPHPERMILTGGRKRRSRTQKRRVLSIY